MVRSMVSIALANKTVVKCSGFYSWLLLMRLTDYFTSACVLLLDRYRSFTWVSARATCWLLYNSLQIPAFSVLLLLDAETPYRGGVLASMVTPLHLGYHVLPVNIRYLWWCCGCHGNPRVWPGCAGLRLSCQADAGPDEQAASPHRLLRRGSERRGPGFQGPPACPRCQQPVLLSPVLGGDEGGGQGRSAHHWSGPGRLWEFAGICVHRLSSESHFFGGGNKQTKNM